MPTAKCQQPNANTTSNDFNTWFKRKRPPKQGDQALSRLSLLFVDSFQGSVSIRKALALIGGCGEQEEEGVGLGSPDPVGQFAAANPRISRILSSASLLRSVQPGDRL